MFRAGLGYIWRHISDEVTRKQGAFAKVVGDDEMEVVAHHNHAMHLDAMLMHLDAMLLRREGEAIKKDLVCIAVRPEQELPTNAATRNQHGFSLWFCKAWQRHAR